MIPTVTTPETYSLKMAQHIANDITKRTGFYFTAIKIAGDHWAVTNQYDPRTQKINTQKTKESEKHRMRELRQKRKRKSLQEDEINQLRRQFITQK